MWHITGYEMYQLLLDQPFVRNSIKFNFDAYLTYYNCPKRLNTEFDLLTWVRTRTKYSVQMITYLNK
jgi:hypothetical protein